MGAQRKLGSNGHEGRIAYRLPPREAVSAPGYSTVMPQLPPALQAEAGNGAQAGYGRQMGPLVSKSKSEELKISAGFQEMSLGERGGRRRDYHDLGVNTRHLMEHVRESKTGTVIEVLSQTRQGETVKITITLTNELPSTSPTCLQFYNIIFRRLLKIMNLQQIGRNYYNPSDPISIPKHRLMIWPGFTTSILQYETSIMLCTDVSHKVLRSETVLDFMYSLYDQVGEQQFRESCTKELIGVIVLTRYNNKTYRVDDIDWESSPKNSFKKSDGTEISFVDYYKMFDYNPHLADWSRETRGAPLTSVKPLENWLLIYTRRNYDAANILVQNLFKVAPAMGIRVNKAIITEAYLRTLKQKITSDTQMVVCVLSSNRKDKYDAIKKYLCTDCPTPSQCVLARTLSKPQTVMAIATKIALQMNCKMGGELWSVEIPAIFNWYSRCVLQDRGQEIVDGLKVCLQAALRTWYSYNEHMPTRIIVYRDGVGDGQLKTLVSYEIPQFLECLKTVGSDYRPKLTVIVVKKRVSSRFFAEIEGKLQNPPPGTVIDLEVTRPEWYDFFIVSQSVKSGTVAPTHYNVIYDSSALKPDYMQRLTYKLCHMYYNWPGVIRVPAPCQYAHKLAFLVGQSIHREPNLTLSEKLYYL
ncbi:hypothetical protein E2320_012707 [Naja naja]|nr:hypothetical protein E2320_012707 [Naja naja]